MLDHEQEMHELVGVHSLGVLDPDEQVRVEQHLEICEDCRLEVSLLLELRAELDEIPPEAFLDGSPPDGDLLLRRTLRVIDGERARARGSHRWRIAGAAAAVVIAAAGVGAGVQLSQPGTPPGPNIAVPSHPGAFAVTGDSQRTGVRLVAQVVPRNGWVQVNARMLGVPPGTKCRLIVQTRDGGLETALSWTAPRNQPESSTELSGAVAVDAHDIAALKVFTFSGEELVTAAL